MGKDEEKGDQEGQRYFCLWGGAKGTKQWGKWAVIGKVGGGRGRAWTRALASTFQGQPLR